MQHTDADKNMTTQTLWGYLQSVAGIPLHSSCLETPMDRGAWQAIVHGVTRLGPDLVTKPPRLPPSTLEQSIP